MAGEIRPETSGLLIKRATTRPVLLESQNTPNQEQQSVFGSQYRTWELFRAALIRKRAILSYGLHMAAPRDGDGSERKKRRREKGRVVLNIVGFEISIFDEFGLFALQANAVRMKYVSYGDAAACLRTIYTAIKLFFID